jgi:hypothetical protein
MKESTGLNQPAAVSISLGDEVGKIERLTLSAEGGAQIRFSLWSQEKMLPHPFVLTEGELVGLLQAAVKEGVLSGDFIGKLHSVTEI